MESWLPTLSKIIGWSYFVAWSISFYFQLFLNWQRKNVSGFSLDFAWLNCYGFLCYSIFNVAFAFSPYIQEEYHRQWDTEDDNTVQINDVFFALHAFTISSLLIIQTYSCSLHNNRFIYPRTIGPSFGDKIPKVSGPVKVFVTTTSFAALVLVGDFFLTGHAWLIDVIYYLSFVKMAVTLSKYAPQAYLNYVRKSTDGWCILLF